MVYETDTGERDGHAKSGTADDLRGERHSTSFQDLGVFFGED